MKNVAEGAFFRACEGAATRGEACEVGATRVQARPRQRSTEKPEQHVPRRARASTGEEYYFY
ncbi:MAG TPA: hypothetical protein VGJ92_02870 [Methanocella sp.]